MTAIVTNREIYYPPRRRLTVNEYQWMSEAGLFAPEERLELVEGEIIEKMSPQLMPHAVSVNLCADVIRPALGQGYHVRVQSPMTFGAHTQPESDVAVISGVPRDYLRAHPTTAALIIEVSDTTLRYDRTTKSAIYARAGIEEYWILNLVDRVLEVHRQPAEMTEEPLGWGYRSVTRYTEADAIAPLAAPNFPIAVADLLP